MIDEAVGAGGDVVAAADVEWIGAIGRLFPSTRTRMAEMASVYGGVHRASECGFEDRHSKETSRP